MIGHRAGSSWGAPLALLATTLFGVGCQGSDSPVAPGAQECPSAPVPLCTDAAQATAVRAAAADAELRLVPALESASSRDVFAQRLTVVAARLGSGDVSGARTALVAARGALADSRAQLSTNPGNAADLSAIELTLDQIAAVLGDS
ncbi:MAG TPA: hypothetical protein VFN39_03010 [Gemmatimonadaceae bacterium]|nr:hypothetical protein [Gemmatimonadaceae bacterium]